MTMKNSELINRPNNDLISGLDRQRRFILLNHSAQKACPNCGTRQNVFEATGVTIDEYDTNLPGEKEATCIECKRGLVYLLPIFGDWRWRLVPIKGEAK